MFVGDSIIGGLTNEDLLPGANALQQMAKGKGVDYIDFAPIFRQHKIQYDEDGSHFTNAFCLVG
ncbi:MULTISPECIES: hypothetical protein [Paenibacillus]|uniref:hypothetical protein n=1 Tax=Paenibacillus TaxID=44249 RepID=UPI0021161C43|nr:hypothetical protein [Paenibacillus lautus]